MLIAVPSRVLVVDNDLGVRDMLRETLRAAGYDVETTGTAAAGLTGARKPDVILLDVGLPGILTGDVAMPVFKEFAPVIIITGSADNALMETTACGGCLRLRAEVVQPPQLFDMVDAAVRSAGSTGDASP